MTAVFALSIAALGLGVCPSHGAVAAQNSAQNPVVVIDTTLGAITLELYPDKAPISVKNFLTYVDEGYYDNLIFHRIIPGFMIQGGGMTDQLVEKTAGTHGPIKNESTNGLSNERGTIAMARKNDPDSATCQFFINHANNHRLDTAGGGYTVFGKVIGGMDVVDEIAKVSTTSRGPYEGVPIKTVYIKSVKRKAS